MPVVKKKNAAQNAVYSGDFARSHHGVRVAITVAIASRLRDGRDVDASRIQLNDLRTEGSIRIIVRVTPEPVGSRISE